MWFITAGGEANQDLEAQQMALMLHLVGKYGDFSGLEDQTGANTSDNSSGHVIVGNLPFFWYPSTDCRPPFISSLAQPGH